MIQNLLLVDDDSDDVSIFREALQEVDPAIGFHSAKNGIVALEFLLDYHTVNPALVFIDINMPQMNGWQCLAELKKHNTLKQIPIVMYSTTALKTDMQKALDMGALALYQKPERYGEWKQLIRSVIDDLPVS
jgi:CheY-like chemotaxis protein